METSWLGTAQHTERAQLFTPQAALSNHCTASQTPQHWYTAPGTVWSSPFPPQFAPRMQSKRLCWNFIPNRRVRAHTSPYKINLSLWQEEYNPSQTTRQTLTPRMQPTCTGVGGQQLQGQDPLPDHADQADVSSDHRHTGLPPRWLLHITRALLAHGG